MGFDVEATKGIQLGIDTKLYEGKSVGAWRSYSAEGGDLRVVCVGGLKCTFRKHPWAAIAGIVRSEEYSRPPKTQNVTDPIYALGSEKEDEAYEIGCELYGEVAESHAKSSETSTLAMGLKLWRGWKTDSEARRRRDAG
ncbi:hypothetical protein F5Y17DRAFT_453628 [Xylariaceae sp. FL0594]|nr:hypothetical protein F5Y17DRAFT_453628 [Xylariaceae sp. FL0594]